MAESGSELLLLRDEISHDRCQCVAKSHEKLAAAEIVVGAFTADGTPFGKVLLPAFVKHFPGTQVVYLVALDRQHIVFFSCSSLF